MEQLGCRGLPVVEEGGGVKWLALNASEYIYICMMGASLWRVCFSKHLRLWDKYFGRAR